MDKAQRRTIFLGLFVILGVVIFIFGIFQIGSKNELFKKTFVISARFSNTTGLKSGSNIRFNGVKCGIVKAVNLINDTDVQVDMSIEESKRGFILQNAIASIASDGLMGDKIVNIIAGQGSSQPVRDNDFIKGRNPLNTDAVLATLNATNENIKVISQNLRVLTTDLNSDSGTLQALYKDPGMAADLRRSFVNLKNVTDRVLQVSRELQGITRQARTGNGTIGHLLNDTSLGANLDYSISKLKETSDGLSHASSQLSVALQNINSGNGAVTMLLTDTAFSANVKQSLLNIKSASKNLDQDMEALKHNFLLRGYFRKQAKKHKQ